MFVLEVAFARISPKVKVHIEKSAQMNQQIEEIGIVRLVVLFVSHTVRHDAVKRENEPSHPPRPFPDNSLVSVAEDSFDLNGFGRLSQGGRVHDPIDIREFIISVN